ncbi:MAG TPA: hypothetical protein VGD88_18000 [Opitutaceae bacterium]
MSLPPSSFPEPAPWLMRKSVLTQGGVDGALHQLGPGAEFTETRAESSRDRVLFASNGQVTVALGPTHYIVSAEEALHLPADTPASVRNATSAPAKVLIVTLPAPRVVTSSLVTLR